MTNLKVLVFDIETSPIIAYVWGLKDQNIGLNQIVKDWELMAFAAKWLNSPISSTVYYDTRTLTEKDVLKRIWLLLDEADIVITQNGKNFDSPKLNARFLYYGMKPPSPYKHLDTYKIAKGVAEFTSNKLEYLTDKLCTKYKKLSHKKFPGMSLWSECLKGNLDAWNEMKQYNIHDVLSTEELYLKLRSWTPNSMPSVYHNGECPVCGKNSLERRGYERKQKYLFRKMHCTSCGKWTIGERIKE